MRTPPNLSDADIQAMLHTHYGLSLNALTFLPIGNDAASFVYRADACDGRCYLLKVRSNGGFSPSSLLIPRFLHDRGIPHIVAPLPTTNGRLWADVNDFALSLYPFIDSRTAANTGLSPQHWRTLGTTLQQIHAIHLPADLQQVVRRETFTPSRRAVLNDIESLITSRDFDDALQHKLAIFWRTHHDEIRTLINRADTLGAQLRDASLPLVLCHADLHTWNVLLDTTGQLWIVDWDEIVLAPRERDLMFVIGGIGHDLVRVEETTYFLQGYGDAAIDQQALVYYRYAWAVQDLGAYTEQAFLAPNSSEEYRRDAVDGFIDLFAPGNIVAIASAT